MEIQIKQLLMSFMVVITFASFAVSFSPLATAANLPIQGSVWLDLNGDGQRSAPGYIDDVGQQGVKITAFDSEGNTSSTLTDEDGNYELETISLKDGPYRLELTVPQGYTPAPIGQKNNTTVIHVVEPGASGVDFSILEPSSYCSSNPRLVVSCFTSGDPSLHSSSPSSTASKASSRVFRFDDEFYPGHPQYSEPQILTTHDQTGTVYGLGYSRKTSTVFQAAFLRRHAGLGPGGTGAIYEVDPNTGNVLRTITVPNAGAIPQGRDLSATTTAPSRDIAAFAAVGKTALGDVKIVGDGNTLFTTNLHTRQLIEISNLSSVTPTIASYDLPQRFSCPGGETDRRLFGLGTKITDGQSKLYVGITCTGETQKQVSHLLGHIVEFDVATSSWGQSVLSFPLNYEKGCALVNSITGNLGCAWRVWSDNYADAPKYQVLNQFFTANPQPLISDIQFDQKGAMIIGIADRGGWQWGHENLPPREPALIFGNPDPFHASNQLHTAFAAGDQLRACQNSDGNYVFENNGTCGDVTTQGANNNQGPGGGEFYWGDTIQRTDGPLTIGHEELGLGSFAFVPGRTTMAATITDPFFTRDNKSDFRSNSVGIAKLSHVNDPTLNQSAGGWYGALELGILSNGTNTFAKAGGLGSLEVLCENAPIEIGNYVWFDANNDGIQDPNEPPLKGVRVTLVDPQTNEELAVAVTNADGQYYFLSEGASNVTSLSIDGPGQGDDNLEDEYGIVKDPDGDLSNDNYGIAQNKDYRIVFDTSFVELNSDLNSLGLTQASQLEPTTSKADPSENGTLRDSNLVTYNGKYVIDLTTASAGSNDHTFDAGFIAKPIQTTTTQTSTTSTPTTISTQPTSTIAPTTSVGGVTTSTPETSVLNDFVERLPFTGSETIQIIAVALIALFVGSMLVFIRKKKQNSP